MLAVQNRAVRKAYIKATGHKPRPNATVNEVKALIHEHIALRRRARG